MESTTQVHGNSLINFSWSYVPRRLILELLDVSVMTLDEWDRKNILKKRKIGGKVYYKLEEVEAVLEQSIG